MVSGQWSMVNRQWSMVNGQRSIVNRQSSIISIAIVKKTINAGLLFQKAYFYKS
jgi:hypothetical protein